VTALDAQRLKVGERVQWPTGARGRVTEKMPGGIRVRWDDGTERTYLFVRGSALRHVARVEA
jgi:hypothetical protein